MRVHRIDFASTLAKPVRRLDGSMIVEARIARSGTQTYRNADGSSRVEYRPDSEVTKSMAGMRLVPLTNDHPREMLTSENARSFAIGTVGENLRRDGAWIVAPLAIFDAATIRALESGKRQISVGYDCELDETPGTTPDGERYDAVQRDITPNHVALVDNARAGRDAAVRMDAAYSEISEPAAPAEKETTVNEELQTACGKHAIRYDSADERGSALQLLAGLGYRGDYKTPNGQRLDERSEAYLTAYAVGKARSHADERKYASAARRYGYEHTDALEPARVARQDVARDDEERYDATTPHYDARVGEALFDEMDPNLEESEPGTFRFDAQGMLIGDYEPSEAYRQARLDFEDRQSVLWIHGRELDAVDERTGRVIKSAREDQKRAEQEREQRIKLRQDQRAQDEQFRADAERCNPKRVDYISPEQMRRQRAETDKARQDMLKSFPKISDPLHVDTRGK